MTTSSNSSFLSSSYNTPESNLFQIRILNQLGEPMEIVRIVREGVTLSFDITIFGRWSREDSQYTLQDLEDIENFEVNFVYSNFEGYERENMNIENFEADGFALTLHV